MVYAAEHPALALLEVLVHSGRSTLPESDQLLEIETGESITEALPGSLKADWRHYETHTRDIGDRWLSSAKSLLPRVPSGILPDSFNVLINPLHPDSARIKVRSAVTHSLDDRLR